MGSKNWSFGIVRVLVLIAGVLVILEALHVMSISITWYALTSDVRSNHNTPEIVAGFLVGTLALIPNRKNRNRRVSGPVRLRWSTINATDKVQHMRLLANLSARRMDGVSLFSFTTISTRMRIK